MDTDGRMDIRWAPGGTVHGQRSAAGGWTGVRVRTVEAMSMPATSTGDPERRSRLLAVKLAALVRDHAGEAPVTPGVWPGGAALIREGEAWVLAEANPERSLGAAMAWARQQGTGRVHLLAETATGVLARRAEMFGGDVSLQVWHVEGRVLLPAIPTPYAEFPEVPPQLRALRPLIEEGGAEPVEEHGVLVGEVAGLEVCRAVVEEWSGEARLEVGVGAHDREAFQMLHGNVPTVASLARIVAEVARHRRPGADPHPLNRLAAERLLRHRILASPDLAGARHLTAAPPPVPRPNLKDPVPCVAIGEAVGGEPLVVVCSTGIDLDLVPYAADARAALGFPTAALHLAVPTRDAIAPLRALASCLSVPAAVVPIEPAPPEGVE